MYLNEGWIDWPATKTKPYPEPWQQTLLEAAQYIRTNGWCQGAYFYRERVCLLGAIRKTRSLLSDKDWYEPRDKVCEALGMPTEYPPNRWNDALGRTEAEVIALLEKAANY